MILFVDLLEGESDFSDRGEADGSCSVFVLYLYLFLCAAESPQVREAF